jgi:hypothetical protein
MARRRIAFPATHFLVLACIVLQYSLFAQAQITNVTNDQATPKFGVGHDYIGGLNEIVSPGNGSLSVRINVPTPSGRGLSFPFSFDYNSNGTIVLSPSGQSGDQCHDRRRFRIRGEAGRMAVRLTSLELQ